MEEKEGESMRGREREREIGRVRKKGSGRMAASFTLPCLSHFSFTSIFSLTSFPSRSRPSSSSQFLPAVLLPCLVIGVTGYHPVLLAAPVCKIVLVAAHTSVHLCYRWCSETLHPLLIDVRHRGRKKEKNLKISANLLKKFLKMSLAVRPLRESSNTSCRLKKRERVRDWRTACKPSHCSLYVLLH